MISSLMLDLQIFQYREPITTRNSNIVFLQKHEQEYILKYKESIEK